MARRKEGSAKAITARDVKKGRDHKDDQITTTQSDEKAEKVLASSTKTVGQVIWIACACLFFGLLAGSLATPFLQHEREELGCDALCYGLMQSARSGLQMVGATVVGRLSDTIGRRLVIFVCLAASALSFGIQVGGGLSVTTMWLALFPSATLNHQASITKALLADYLLSSVPPASTNNKDSVSTAPSSTAATGLGRVGMVAGLAMMVGPLLSTTFFNSATQALTAALVFAGVAALFLVLLPSDLHNVSVKETKEICKSSENILTEWRRRFQQFFSLPVLKTAGARVLLTIRVCMSLGYHLFMTYWLPSLRARFSDFGPRQHALFMGWIGLCYALSQGFVAPFLVKRFASQDSTKLMFICTILLSGGRAVATIVQTWSLVYISMALVIVALGVSNTILATKCAQLAGQAQIGGFFGLMDAAEGVAGLFGPTIGGLLFRQHIQAPLVGLVVVYSFVGVIVLTRFHKDVDMCETPSETPQAVKIHVD